MTRTWTEAELMALPEDGLKRELVGGEIVVSPAGHRHGRVNMRLGARLQSFVEEHRLGHACCSSTGVWMPSGNLRVPDVSFFSNERDAEMLDPDAFCAVAPDLAVEVLSKGDSAKYVRAKVEEYLASGVRLVWIIDPRARKATVHRPGSPAREIGAEGMLDGEDVVPGFRCALSDILV